jgi:hypothetical protein
MHLLKKGQVSKDITSFTFSFYLGILYICWCCPYSGWVFSTPFADPHANFFWIPPSQIHPEICFNNFQGISQFIQVDNQRPGVVAQVYKPNYLVGLWFKVSLGKREKGCMILSQPLSWCGDVHLSSKLNEKEQIGGS